jgi:hypothetical protein
MAASSSGRREECEAGVRRRKCEALREAYGGSDGFSGESPARSV